MEITACPNCGSKNIGIGTLGDGIISGLSSWKEVCKDCGYQGASLLFDSEIEYKKFIDALSNAKKQTVEQKEQTKDENAEEESLDLTEEKRQVLEFLDETEEAPELPKKKNHFLEFVLAVILSVMFFIALLGSSYFGAHNALFSDDDHFTFVLYVIGSFVGVLISFFLLIVFVETIYRSIRGRKNN
jgi:transcription elongation factor Elf1